LQLCVFALKTVGIWAPLLSSDLVVGVIDRRPDRHGKHTSWLSVGGRTVKRGAVPTRFNDVSKHLWEQCMRIVC
jgi:hypothetical protein